MTANVTNPTDQNSSVTANESSDEIDVGKLVNEVISERWMILAVTFVFGFCGFIYAELITPVYKSNALIQVEDNSSGVLALDDIGDMFAEESSADTEIYILKSRSVLGKTVDDLNLTVKVKPNYFPVLGGFFASRHRSTELATPMFGSIYAWGGEQVIVSDMRLPKKFLSKFLTLIVEDDQRYSVWFDEEKLLTGEVGSFASNTEKGIDIKVERLYANKGTHFFIKKKSRLKAIMDLQNEFQAANLGKDTGIMELTLHGSDKAKIAAILNSISANYVNQNVQRLAAEAENSLNFIKDQLPKVRASLNDSEMALNTYRAARESVDLSLETQSLLESYVKLEADISVMSLNEADISRRFTKQHPNYLTFKRQQVDLFSQRDRLNTKIGALPETQQKILTLMRDFEVNQAIYLSLQNKSQELAIVKASTVGNVRILDSAEVFPTKSSPKNGIIFTVAVVLGAFLSILFVLVRSIVNPGVSSAHEFQKLGLNVYATIPASSIQIKFDRMKALLKKRRNVYTGSELLLSNDYPTDLSVEAIRSLRTSLHFGMMEARNNSIMITSGSAEVGKSFVASNFCTVLAQSGQRVLLVDADLRRGYLHERLSVSVGSGLSDYLRGSFSIGDITKKTNIDGLDIITRGAVPPNPSELLMNDRFKSFIDEASKAYDLIVIDTPPILAVTDAAVIGQSVGTAMLVARFERTTVREVEAAKERFRLNGIEIKGLVFNAIEAKASTYYGGYSYYNYSYSSNSSDSSDSSDSSRDS